MVSIPILHVFKDRSFNEQSNTGLYPQLPTATTFQNLVSQTGLSTLNGLLNSLESRPTGRESIRPVRARQRDPPARKNYQRLGLDHCRWRGTHHRYRPAKHNPSGTERSFHRMSDEVWKISQRGHRVGTSEFSLSNRTARITQGEEHRV